VNNEEQYEVEAVTAHKCVRGKLRFLVKWKGYPSSENTWQTEEDLKDTSEILQIYITQYLYNESCSSSSF
jgi:hypothetical protein